MKRLRRAERWFLFVFVVALSAWLVAAARLRGSDPLVATTKSDLVPLLELIMLFCSRALLLFVAPGAALYLAVARYFDWKSGDDRLREAAASLRDSK